MMQQTESTAQQEPRDWKTVISALALGVSALSLCVSAYAQYAARTAASATKALETRQVISEFNSKGESLPTAATCFKVAQAMTDEQIKTVFSDDGMPTNIPNSSEKSTLRCIRNFHDKKISNLDDEELDTFRRQILYKLNSFDDAFRSIRQNVGIKEDICRAIWPSFKQGPYQFIKRVEDINPRPEEFQDMYTSYADVLTATDKGLCDSTG